MFRLNRMRFAGLICLALFLYYLIFTESASTSSYRASTEAALARQRSKHRSPLRGDLSDEELRDKVKKELNDLIYSKQQPVQEVQVGAKEAKATSNADGDHAQHEHERDHEHEKMSHEVEDVSIAGRKIIPKPKYPVEDQKALSEEEKELGNGADPAKDLAREKLSEYLKTPVVIFSKSYCPHSARAKHLLLEVYDIVPRPKVVELDMLSERIDDDSDDPSPVPMTLGRKLQGLLGEVTGRKTVPNIMVGGLHSIGGNDKIWDLHVQGKLVDEIRNLGGKKIVSINVNKGVE